MRIIAGQLKGRKILKPSDSKTRPLKDLVKESIFNIIKHSKKLNINIEMGGLKFKQRNEEYTYQLILY